ncbi:hypothetical protein SRH_02715 [Mesomycoplasma hyorhinis MCLD]|uniref:Uncharacterized protein n=1 Tax=Mesomycoplasma hyorhinis (strain MCLD) TaxID=936139 RepID=A0ABM5M6J3_MESHM|nr:hypothetical protein SRH_02715 [Mesomycoplasma hyorhinis MCLD]
MIFLILGLTTAIIKIKNIGTTKIIKIKIIKLTKIATFKLLLKLSAVYGKIIFSSFYI